MTLDRRLSVTDNYLMNTALAAVLFICLGLVIGLFGGWFWEISRDRIRPSAELTSEQTLELTGAPNQDVRFYLTERYVIGEQWRTDGLNMHIGDQSVQVVEPHQDDWGEAVSTTNRALDTVKLDGAFRTPDIAPGQTLQGMIIGTVTVPKPADNGRFSNTSVTAEIPIKLHVVTPQDAETWRQDKQGIFPVIYPYMLGLAIAMLTAGLILVLSYQILNHYFKTRRPMPQSFMYGLGLAIIVIFLISGALGARWFIVDQSHVTATAPEFGNTSTIESTSRPNLVYRYLGDERGQGGFEVRYPADWMKLVCPDESGVVHFAPDGRSLLVCGTGQQSLVTVSSTVFENQALESICTEVGNLDYVTGMTCDYRNIDDSRWLRMSYATNDKAPDSLGGTDVVSYVTFREGRVYALAYNQREDYPDEKRVFEDIVASFKFI